jgi:hypothetical protein
MVEAVYLPNKNTLIISRTLVLGDTGLEKNVDYICLNMVFFSVVSLYH